MSLRLAHILRHPIKAVGHEELAGAELTAGAAMPFDRVWAVGHAGAKVGPDLTEWAPKLNFLRGVAGPELMAISATSEPQARRMTLSHPRAGTLTVAPDAPRDAARLIAWLAPLWPESRPAPAFVVSVPGQAMTDNPPPYLSILNLASNRALGDRLGQDLSIHRWRGNLWLDGLEPFGEFDLVGRSLRIGAAVLKVEQRITRCKATTVNPDTGASDADTLGGLRAGWGHEDLGVFATVTKGGPIALDDTVELIA
jgi:uncharacterized protein